MGTFTKSLAANKSVLIGAGNNFYLESADHPVTIEIQESGRTIETIKDAIAGTRWTPGRNPLHGDNLAFDGVLITAGASATEFRAQCTRAGFVDRDFEKRNALTLNQSAVAVLAAETVLVAQNNKRLGVTFHNTHATEPIQIGPAGVTVAAGMILLAGEKYSPPEGCKAAWSAIRSATAVEVRVLEMLAS